MRQFEDDRRRKTKKKADEPDGNGSVAVYTAAPSAVTAPAAGRSGNSRRVTPTNGAADHHPQPAERLLQNGDIYTGTFAGSVPHGAGKYLWRDGCMYEGEWRKGKASGRGRFSWPSGATFEGEFKAGRMDGQGTFTGPDGDTYVGAWAADRKHGFGRKCYANGDFYEGSWRKNRQEGHGRYVWRNGNQYIGEWKAGVISGRGVLIWSNGNRYDGQWDGGVPKGSGVFTWPDGSCYIGCWSDYPTFHLNGTFYHGAGKRAKESYDAGWECGVGRGTRKRSSFDGGRMSFTDKVSNFPRICIWDSDGEAGDITCDIIDNVTCVAAATTPDRGLACAMKNRKPCRLTAADVKKPGQTIAKGHKNYELMLNLQLGISYSVGKLASFQKRSALRASDFDPREKFWTRFPPEGSKITPPHQSAEFKWKDYCPMVFRHLRDLFGVDPADYMVAICGNDALRELSSPGKSGSIFYMTQDDRFMIKTVKKCEVKVLLRMLPSYYEHVSKYENSLVTKFFGVHCVKPVGGQKVRFVVMGNLFCSEYRIHKRFDLKGSSYGRITDKAEAKIDETTTLKDLDLNYVFHLQKSWFEDLMRQLDRDCQFLEAERIMDYSLLVGIHFRNDGAAEKMGLSPASPSEGKNELQKEDNFLLAEGRNPTRIFSGRKPWIRLGANMPAWAQEVGRRSYSDNYSPRRSNGGDATPTGTGGTYEVILYFGIIDILQDYDISKKLEHAYKSLQVDPTSISAVDPKLYSKRFRDFIGKIFVEDKSTWT